jgi:hypothetical protein
MTIMNCPAPETAPHPATAVQAANARLWALRANHAAQRTPDTASDLTRQPASDLPNSPALPPHLGWHSAAVTAALRRRVPPTPSTGLDFDAIHHTAGLADDTGSADAWPNGRTVRLHPSLSLAFLRTRQTACGRLWLLLRTLDTDGRGWLSVAEVQAQLTRRGAAGRLCGPRQLRALLQQGRGLFWQRDKTHIWLSSALQVAHRLGVARLSGRPLALPATVLLQPIGLLRAHLYASFHSSRMGRDGAEGKPISRAALTAVAGVSRRTQHTYERRAGVRVQSNIVIGPRLNSDRVETAVWRQGRAAFIWTDRKGEQGTPGQRYLAWRLPNSYRGPHRPLGRGRQRQLNRQLVDLRQKGDVGNGRETEWWGRRRYAVNGVQAERYTRRCGGGIYWRGARAGRGAVVWHLLGEDGG